MTYNIDRFYDVHRLYFEAALNEIRSGCKQTHWMWYILPQLNTLGGSFESIYYGIADVDEARAFYEDEYLGTSLKTICHALLGCESDNAFDVMGYPDNLKLRSSMTLFYIATGDELFADVLNKFYGGSQDEITRSQILGNK